MIVGLNGLGAHSLRLTQRLDQMNTYRTKIVSASWNRKPVSTVGNYFQTALWPPDDSLIILTASFRSSTETIDAN